MRKPQKHGRVPAPVPDPENPAQNNIIAEVKASLWHGPLPPPDALAAFNDVIPNGAERIFAEWEGETLHRRKIEMIAAGLDAAERLGSKLLAAIFVFVALGSAIFLGYEGHDWLAGVIATTTIGTVLGAFLYSKGRTAPPSSF